MLDFALGALAGVPAEDAGQFPIPTQNAARIFWRLDAQTRACAAAGRGRPAGLLLRAA